MTWFSRSTCPRRRFRRLFAGWLPVCILVAVPGLAVVWHVDPGAPAGGDGSGEHPFATLADAVTALPGAPDEPLTLHLAPGTHRLGSPLVITARETRGRPLTVRGSQGALVSGGRALEDWRVEDGRWIHPWVEGPVRELFVDGRRAPRSRFPAQGWQRVERALPDKRSGFSSQGPLPPLEPGIELLLLHDWSVSRIPVASISGRDLKTTGPIGFPADHFRIDHFEPHPRFCLENGRSFLGEPGAWCHDPAGKRIVYLPRPGERHPSDTAFVVPVAERLVRVAGTPGTPVADVRFEQIGFAHCRWEVNRLGYAAGQATKHDPRGETDEGGHPYHAWRFVPWAVEVQWATGVQFEQCDFSSLGGSGVLLGTGARDCSIRRCRIFDVSGNGIGIGEGAARNLPNGEPWWKGAPEQAASGNRVELCDVSLCGRQFHGAVGIWAGLARETVIATNHVHHLPYTGISVGWRWNPEPTPCRGNRVEYNHIHHVMQLLSDGGGIYTLGRQPGTILRRNHIHDVPLNAGRAESNGMFLDEGSSAFSIEENLIHATDRSPLRFHKAGEIEVRGNGWRLPPGTPALRFNNTPRENIHDRENRDLDEASLGGEATRWGAGWRKAFGAM